MEEANTEPRLDAVQAITSGDVSVGIELGSTRIKAVLVDSHAETLAVGSCGWENSLLDGVWTYGLEEVWAGLQKTFAALQAQVEKNFGVRVRNVRHMGISAMMHGYLAFAGDGTLLVPFRTWRNTITGQASRELTEVLGMNIPQRWSIAHFYQAILNQEAHVGKVEFLTTLAGYVHWKLTGERVLGVGDASGMFPVAADGSDYDRELVLRFDALVADKAVGKWQSDSDNGAWTVKNLLPEVKVSGQVAGTLTAEGALLLDPNGELQPGAVFCPPEGDAGTGMVATNAVKPRSGNVSVGTSVFAMVVLPKPLTAVHEEIDVVTTPDGIPVAMVHCNNGTSELDAWINIFAQFNRLQGVELETSCLYDLIYQTALEASPDGGGLVSFNYLSGEPVTQTSAGKPLFLRNPDSQLNLPNFFRTQLMSIFATLRLGMDILTEEEGVRVDKLVAHGGVFATPMVAQTVLSAALKTPVLVYGGASEGGAWGIATLANFLREEFNSMTLSQYLDALFADSDSQEVMADSDAVAGYERFLARYRAAIPVQMMAADL